MEPPAHFLNSVYLCNPRSGPPLARGPFFRYFLLSSCPNSPEAFLWPQEEAVVIHVSNLTKYYGDYAAVRNVSFDVPRGQVVGFLGPNGAGKSTTMRILAGYLTATSGRATIAGLDVFWQPVEVRRLIGYMPENCPLYPEMRVAEYLRFRAGIKGLHGGDAKKRVEYVLDRCWVRDVRRQLIGTLSKGYRQRVGLADVLLNSPPVLILDEPTAGLDPGQIRETRKLIRELGQEHTILLSTHILSEVEVTCDQAIIINRGQVVATGRLVDLKPENQSLEEMFIDLIEREAVVRA
jgi:gliding motility-associated transport system ATP-binding protein